MNPALHISVSDSHSFQKKMAGEKGWKKHRHIDLSEITPALLGFHRWTLQMFNDPCRSELLTRNVTFKSKSRYSHGAAHGGSKRQLERTKENGVHRVHLSSHTVMEHTQMI